MRASRFVYSCVLLLAAAGCGTNHVPTYRASGLVRFSDGQPVRFGIIEFHSEAGGPSPHAKLNEDGRFDLGTFTSDDGAPAGAYRVIIVQHFDVPASASNPHLSSRTVIAHEETHGDARVAKQFSERTSTPLRAKVEADGKNEFEFVVTHPRRKLPPSIARPGQTEKAH